MSVWYVVVVVLTGLRADPQVRGPFSTLEACELARASYAARDTEAYHDHWASVCLASNYMPADARFQDLRP